MPPDHASTDQMDPPEAPLPFFVGGAERAFRVDAGRRLADGRVEVTMRTGPWMVGPDGRPSLGGLGVLIDDTVGYAVVLDRPAGHWATSQEIHVETVGTPPTDGSLLTGHATVTSRDTGSGLASGEIIDARGNLVAVITQRLRFIPGTPGDPAPGSDRSTDRPTEDGDVLAQLGAVTEDTPAGARLTVPLAASARNPMGTLHGGILLCGSELSGLRALSDDEREALVTSSVKINYLRPGPVSGDIVFEAQRIHRGRSVGVAEVVTRTPEGKLCTRATVTAHLP